jgi:hypothetical protein
MWLLANFNEVGLSVPHGGDWLLIAPLAEVNALQYLAYFDWVLLLVSQFEVMVLGKTCLDILIALSKID